MLTKTFDLNFAVNLTFAFRFVQSFFSLPNFHIIIFVIEQSVFSRSRLVTVFISVYHEIQCSSIFTKFQIFKSFQSVTNTSAVQSNRTHDLYQVKMAIQAHTKRSQDGHTSIKSAHLQQQTMSEPKNTSKQIFFSIKKSTEFPFTNHFYIFI